MKDGGGTKQNSSNPRRVSKEKLMEKGPSKFTAPKRQPMQTGPRKLTDMDRRRIMLKKDGGGVETAIKEAAITAANALGKTQGYIMDIARMTKPSGRLSVEDIKKAKQLIVQGVDNPRNRMKGPGKEVMGTKSRVEAPQTKTLNRPKQSIFQQLKKAQMRRKMGTMGNK